MAERTTDYQPILDLYSEGYGPSEIIERLSLTISRRQIQRIVENAGIKRALPGRNGRLDEDGLGVGPFQDIVFQLLTGMRGLDPYLCSECGKRQVKRCDIHHTKYEGATIYDLAFLCRRCNTSARNRGLA